MEDISDLLLQLKQGCDEVLDVLYPHYRRIFYVYARRHQLLHEDAEDVVQMTFWRLLDGIESYDEQRESGEKWLWRICRNQLIDHLRRQKNNVSLDEAEVVEEFDPDRFLIDQEHYLTLTRGWTALAESERAELRRGRGRGPGRKAWHGVVAKLRILCLENEA